MAHTHRYSVHMTSHCVKLTTSCFFNLFRTWWILWVYENHFSWIKLDNVRLCVLYWIKLNTNLIHFNYNKTLLFNGSPPLHVFWPWHVSFLCSLTSTQKLHSFAPCHPTRTPEPQPPQLTLTTIPVRINVQLNWINIIQTCFIPACLSNSEIPDSITLRLGGSWKVSVR